ncbi:MAG: glycosyltransferase [Acidobacteria bacterium]|nr:glycosyltransferase [Acidobacteriota bacterium]
MLAAAGDTPVHRIYHGLNAELASRVHETADLVSGSRHAIRMLGVGRLVHKKGFDVFIAACGLLAARGVPFTAVLVGEDGEHGPALRDAVTRAGLEDHVVFAGPMTQAQLFQEYQRASVFCLPCRVVDNGDRDGIPNVLMEAMVCGVPVVTTAISGIPELVRDGDNGLFVPVGDAASLADAVLRIHQDPALATRLSQAGRQTIERDFDGDRLAGHLASLFHEVTA